MSEQMTMPPMAGAGRPAPALKHFVFTKHPVANVLIPPLSLRQIREWSVKPGGADKLLSYWEDHEKLIREANEDPLRHGFELEFWNDVRAFIKQKDEIYALGGNGPGKTEIGGKLVVEKLISAGGMKVLCVATNDGSSKQLQQPAVYKYLPAHYRDRNEQVGPRKRDKVQNISYSPKNGFTEGNFVLPNRSQCWFKTVEQFQRDAGSFEGPEYDLVWLDEPVPVAMLETLRYRIAKRAGKLFHTYTAIFGYDATCAMVLNGARLIKSYPMNWQWSLAAGQVGFDRGYLDPRIIIPELNMAEEQVRGVPKGHMPYMMQPLNQAQGVIFLWTQWNVFLPRSATNPAVPAVFDKTQGKSKGTVRTRLFGWAEKLTGCQFPAFNPNIHVVPHANIAEMLKENKLTTFMACDPATARSYFMLWIGIDKLGRRFVFDESPRVEEGEWVSDEGERGDGTRIYAGKGINFYKTLIRTRELEHMAEAFRRFGDPRAFATEAAAAGGGRSLLELFADYDENNPDSEATAPMQFEAAKVMRSLLAESASGSLDKINDALSYDETKELTVMNEPHLYISDRCQNLIKAMLNWDPLQGEKSAWKDPVDVLRYLFGEPLYYVDPNIPEIVGGRGWGARR